MKISQFGNVTTMYYCLFLLKCTVEVYQSQNTSKKCIPNPQCQMSFLHGKGAASNSVQLQEVPFCREIPPACSGVGGVPVTRVEQ